MRTYTGAGHEAGGQQVFKPRVGLSLRRTLRECRRSWRLLLSAARGRWADLYTAVAETTDHGYPVRDHLARLVEDGSIIWAPALE